jgi:cellulose synthase/poly-beta-1,6-N-acetylglucosamine synthase-like glycosyltransferase
VALAASSLLAFVQGILLLCVAYHFVLLLASIRQPSQPSRSAAPGTRFAILIPAHNEAAVLPATLAQLQRQDYVRALFDVHVVADHCSDDTVEVARKGGAIGHVRTSAPSGQKSHALGWLLDRILAADPAYDAVAVFDADSLVAPEFLGVMDAHLQAGAPVLQGQHIISNPHDSWLAAMAAVDMRLNNRLRNQSRRNLGLSCRLMGDAMVFDARILRDHGWLGATLTEDREYGYELLLRGIQVRYVPQARSYGQAAGSWHQARPQRLRWYRGVVGMQRRLVGRLMRGILRSRSLALLDGLLELIMPSYSFLVALSLLNLGVVLAAAWWLPSVRGLLGPVEAVGLVAAWVLYPVLGLTIDRAPAWAFRALLLGPVYLLWRLWISVLVRLRGDRVRWIRTQRREESA